MSKPPATRYRTMNWSSYNASLRKRGSLLIWIVRVMTWVVPRDGRLGRSAVVSDAAIQFCLSIKVFFKLRLLQTVGMVASLLRLAELNWSVPDFPTLCRRQKTLTVQIPIAARMPCGTCWSTAPVSSPWATANGGRVSMARRGRRQWRKVQLDVLATMDRISRPKPHSGKDAAPEGLRRTHRREKPPIARRPKSTSASPS